MRILRPSRLVFIATIFAAAVAGPAGAQIADGPRGLPPEPVYGYNSGFQATANAARAIENKQYGEAWAHLRDIAPGSRSAEVNFLAGLANAGTGDLLIARRYFAQAAALSPRWSAPQTALAVTDIHLGNRRAVEARLMRLERRQHLCNTRCDAAGEIDESALAVRRVLARY